MASQRQHRSRLAARLGRLRRVLARLSVLAGSALAGSALAGSALAVGATAPANASVRLERDTLETRVQAVRATLQEREAADRADGANVADTGVAPDGTSPTPAPVRTAQWFNWGNWNNWNNWKNWGNWLNR